MNKILFLTFPVVLLVTSCSSNVDNIINYDNTNPIKIEQATDGLDLAALLPEAKILGNGTISIRSIEMDIDHYLDIGVLYMIEDNLISNLLKNGFNVVERDPDALGNLYRESSTKYRKENPKYDINLKKSLQEINNDVSLEGPAIAADGSVINININDERYDKNESIKDYDINKTDLIEEEFINTDLTSASYILTYRVLECGVVYNEIDENNKQKRDNTILLEAENIVDDKIERAARTRLHVRLTSTKSSEIIAAGIVENEVTDIIKVSDMEDLHQISYEYYHHTLPLQQLGALSKTDGYAEPAKQSFLDKLLNKDKDKEINKKQKKKKKFVFRKLLRIPLFILIFGGD